MNPGIIVICLTTFIAVTTLVLACFSLRRDHDTVDQRLAGLSNHASPSSTRPVRSRRSLADKPASRKTRLALQLMPNEDQERHRLQTRLMHAGIYSPLALPLFITIKILLIGLPPVIGALLGVYGWADPHYSLLGGSLVGGLGLIVPGFWLRAQKRRWHVIIGKSLPDFLDLMVACLEAGSSAEAALKRVTDEVKLAHPRLSAELSVVQAHIELGATSDAALLNFADRTDCDAIRSIASIIQQARRLGGGIAEAFRQQAESLRTRREHLAEERAQQASVKILVPTLLFIFPAIFVVLAGPAVIQLSEKFCTGDSSGASLTATFK